MARLMKFYSSSPSRYDDDGLRSTPRLGIVANALQPHAERHPSIVPSCAQIHDKPRLRAIRAALAIRQFQCRRKSRAGRPNKLARCSKWRQSHKQRQLSIASEHDADDVSQCQLQQLPLSRATGQPALFATIFGGKSNAQLSLVTFAHDAGPPQRLADGHGPTIDFQSAADERYQ